MKDVSQIGEHRVKERISFWKTEDLLASLENQISLNDQIQRQYWKGQCHIEKRSWGLLSHITTILIQPWGRLVFPPPPHLQCHLTMFGQDTVESLVYQTLSERVPISLSRPVMEWYWESIVCYPHLHTIDSLSVTSRDNPGLSMWVLRASQDFLYTTQHCP